MLFLTSLTNFKRFTVKPLLALVAVVGLIKVYLSIYFANTDLTIGRFALYMDEQVLYDGVFKILNSENIKSFFFLCF